MNKSEYYRLNTLDVENNRRREKEIAVAQRKQFGRMAEAEQSLETLKEPAVNLRGFGIVRSDLGELDDILDFSFNCKQKNIHNTGSRPWCILSEIEYDEWGDIIDEISKCDYKIHAMVIGISQNGLGRESIRNVASELRGSVEEFESYIGEVNIFSGEDEISVVSHDHLDGFWAKAIIASIEEYVNQEREKPRMQF